jgi:organic hydroperoxide reductase OsmC/OhrA
MHTYRSVLTWRGSTDAGYDHYDRTHDVELPPAAGTFRLSSDAAFRGNASLANPEQLLLAAASSCQLLSFLAVAARARIDIVSYEDNAEAVMPTDAKPPRITQIRLRPRITVAGGTNLDRVHRLVGLAHEECFIANSLSAEVDLAPTIETADAADA